MLLDQTIIQVNSEIKSIIEFHTEGDANWPIWDRYITINGKKAYHIGNICGTCGFFFTQLKDAHKLSLDINNTREKLANGLVKLDAALINQLALLMPNGKYHVLLSRIRPKLILPGQEGDYFSEEKIVLWEDLRYEDLHNPNTNYYRLKTMGWPEKRRSFFEFLIPLFAQEHLDENRVIYYQDLLIKSASYEPTAFALSVADCKYPYSARMSHLCLAHYLLDGHHKIQAAAFLGKPLTLISFLAVDSSNLFPNELDEVLSLLIKS
jgi:hypothetical protein